MFFLELPFLVRHIPIRKEEGDQSKGLKFFTDPVSFLRSLGPLGTPSLQLWSVCSDCLEDGQLSCAGDPWEIYCI